MRLGVHLRGGAEGRPAELQYPAPAGQCGKVQAFGHLVHLPDIFAQINLPVFTDHCAADRIVAAVRQPAPGFDQQRAEILFLLCDNTEDSAHL